MPSWFRSITDKPHLLRARLVQEQLICPGRSCTFFLQSSIKQWRNHADRLVGAGPANQDECATQAPLHIHPVPGPLPEGQNVGNTSPAHCRPGNECATPSRAAGGCGWAARGALPQGAQRRLQRVLVAGPPTSLVAGGCGGGAAVSGHPGERVLTRVRAGGGSRSTGPYGAGRSRSHAVA